MNKKTNIARIIKLLSIIIFSVGSVSISAQTSTITQFKLQGKHSFNHKGAEKWKVAQELIDEKTGESVVNDNFAEANGSNAKFDLPKVGKKETIYHVSAEGKDTKTEYLVRVFEAGKISSFYFKTEVNPPIRTYIFLPKTLSPKSKFIVVMHGLSRNADDYILSWEKWAGKNDYVVIAPSFNNKDWKGAAKYNIGNILTKDEKKIRKEKWTFRIVDDIQKTTASGLGLNNSFYDIFGHSAGGQFVHRFMLFMPEARVRVALAANPGWYTLPDSQQQFPYGLKHEKLSFTAAEIFNWTRRNVMILRGTNDIERTANLQQTPEADAQGQNRFERAAYMYDKIKKINPDTNWRLIEAPKVGHEQARMAIAAQYVLDILNLNNKGG